MREDVAVADLIFIIDERARIGGDFGASMMLEPDPAKLVRNRVEEIIMVVMARAEGLDRLLDHPAMLGDHRRRNRKLLGVMRETVERGAIAKIVAAIMKPRENRRILKRLIADFAEGDPVDPGGARRRDRTKRRRGFPSGGQGDACDHRDPPRVITRGIKRHRFKLQIEHFGSDDDAALARIDRRQKGETRLD